MVRVLSSGANGGQYDNRLHYALKKVKDVEVYLYRVDFKLQEFAKPSK
jgi:hypothetical protein